MVKPRKACAVRVPAAVPWAAWAGIREGGRSGGPGLSPEPLLAWTEEPLEAPESHTWAPQGAEPFGMSHLDDRGSRAFLAGRTLANR